MSIALPTMPGSLAIKLKRRRRGLGTAGLGRSRPLIGGAVGALNTSPRWQAARETGVARSDLLMAVSNVPIPAVSRGTQ
jgi:hypothetical protein